VTEAKLLSCEVGRESFRGLRSFALVLRNQVSRVSGHSGTWGILKTESSDVPSRMSCCRLRWQVAVAVEPPDWRPVISWHGARRMLSTCSARNDEGVQSLLRQSAFVYPERRPRQIMVNHALFLGSRDRHVPLVSGKIDSKFFRDNSHQRRGLHFLARSVSFRWDELKLRTSSSMLLHHR
jgi:hypothetical protein